MSSFTEQMGTTSSWNSAWLKIHFKYQKLLAQLNNA